MLIARQGFDPSPHLLPTGGLMMARALKGRLTLAEAMTRTLAEHPGADIVALVTLFFTSGALTLDPATLLKGAPSMQALVTVHTRVFGALETHLAPALLPTLARFVFVAALFGYYWTSGLTKIGDGLPGFLNISSGAYIQIVPRAFDAVGYDPSALGLLPRMVVLFGTWAEFILPVLLLIGLFTRLRRLGWWASSRCRHGWT